MSNLPQGAAHDRAAPYNQPEPKEYRHYFQSCLAWEDARLQCPEDVPRLHYFVSYVYLTWHEAGMYALQWCDRQGLVFTGMCDPAEGAEFVETWIE
jgi:hypothetical protein